MKVKKILKKALVDIVKMVNQEKNQQALYKNDFNN
jgi:hypothetical protein